jgi:hypothetical protein
MGYRSEIAYAVKFRNAEDRQKLIESLSAGVYEAALPLLEVDDPTMIRGHHSWIKWYSTRLNGGLDIGNYPDVDAVEAILNEAELAYGIWQDTDGAEGIRSVGVFVRLGEETDDGEESNWGSGGEDGLPEPFELATPIRSIQIGW